MQSRMKNHPAFVVPKAIDALYALGGAVQKSNVPRKLLLLIELRASQINGCGYCVDMHARELVEAGEEPRRIFAVGAWSDSPLFTDAERAVLALTEAATRIADRTDPVSDEVWSEVAKHFDEQALSTIVLDIAMINLWNRVNVTTRQIAGAQHE